MESGRTGVGTAYAILLLGGVLALVGKMLADSQEASASSGLAYLVGSGVAIFGTLVLVWWCLSFCFAFIAKVLTRVGRPNAAQRIGAFAPAFMHRAAGLALGVSLIAAPSAHAGAPVPSLSSAADQVHAAGEGPALSPQWAPVEAPAVLDPSWRPTAPPPAGNLLIKEPREGRSSHVAVGGEVVVQPGDSLWTITARYLGPAASDAQVAETWPQWYAANKDVIGENAQLLQPGQALHPPTGSSADSK
ncbi:LysM peptidoglycan-binding domain-containing protein [uncultured Arthrobacter sp.]|uniref:LysM peptidoglycan-binding domain-containing protein n=1 Tax=uncultured Arthrobacter sp. TaxID=114050 RepID=UPI0026317F27|nr:LysM domain-containing protein [uncultured Arthrobacter sp.]